MIVSALDYELLEEHGFTILRDGGHLMFWDDQTEETYPPKRAIAMAYARQRERKHKANMETDPPPGYHLIGVRTGTLAAQLAQETFAEKDWLCVENDPKGTDFPMHVFMVKQEDIDAFMDIYMNVSGRNPS